jgi:hypothetical protein
VDDSAEGNGNTARLHGTDPAAVEILQKSLHCGWDSTEYLPCVRKMPNGSEYEYELVYGFNRVEALENLDKKQFYFDVAECDDSQIFDIRTIENEGLPKALNKEADISHSTCEKISKGFLSKDEDSIRDYVDTICLFRSKQSKDNIVKQVMEKSGMESPFTEYTEAKVKRWVKNHCDTPYAFGGELVNGVHTFLCKQGSAYRTYHRMMKRFLETGKPCQVVFHVGKPTPKSNVLDKRRKTLEAWNEGISHMQALGCDTSFMKVAGFLPQVKDTDKWNKLVQVK